ncbi:hypothetical protein ACTJIJ_01005 [Niabella sp. 22666]|uniref:hypothetical protein n=1 Tax=Niabella sp. 22666 TaxID=3453954 RepID=UPI003F877F4A
MLKPLYLYFILVLFVFTSCAGLRSISFTSDNIQPGMTKAQVISKFGKPDRESFNKTENNVLYETLYYVHFEPKGTASYYDYILDFKNGELVSMRNEPQVDKSVKTITVKKE